MADPLHLEGRFVRLSPLALEHVDALLAAASEDRSTYGLTWEVHAVRFCTDRRNDRSRRAIERLGCTLDGIVRADRPAADGTIRDSAYFSLLAGEWPAAKQQLSERLAAG